MFKVLKIDGPNIMTDKGGICLQAFSYADGGKTQPVSREDWRKMRDAFVELPALLSALDAMFPANQWEAQLANVAPTGPVQVTLICTRDELLTLRAALATLQGDNS